MKLSSEHLFNIHRFGIRVAANLPTLRDTFSLWVPVNSETDFGALWWVDD